jgi:GST-like protein
MTTKAFRLYELPGWGSAIVEAQLAEYGLPVDLVTGGDMDDRETVRRVMAPLNPLAQIPVLVLPSGEVMTESAAMTLHLADLTGSAVLVPEPGAAERAAFLRWLVYLVANIYPSFTYADIPSRFVSAAETPAYCAKVDAYACEMWRILERAVAASGGPWVLGRRFTALDIYVAVMTRWQPGPGWFAAEAPDLARIAAAAAARPALVPVFARNFP